MKKLSLMFALIAIILTLTQNSFAQDTTRTQPGQLLNAYYKLKGALIGSNATLAAINAEEMVNVINGADKQTINDDGRGSLLKAANTISQLEDIKLQREKFATLSNNMFQLAKTVRLSVDPVYEQYCPMKKALWLSNEKAIKNPYYGSGMLTCGFIKSSL